MLRVLALGASIACIPYGAIMHVENNATVKKGDSMFEWDPYNSPIITNV